MSAFTSTHSSLNIGIFVQNAVGINLHLQGIHADLGSLNGARREHCILTPKTQMHPFIMFRRSSAPTELIPWPPLHASPSRRLPQWFLFLMSYVPEISRLDDA